MMRALCCSAICRCGTCRCICVRRCRWKTTRCSPCRMPARQSGIWLIRLGSSRRSCCRSTCRISGHIIRPSAICSIPTTTPSATGLCAALRHVLSRPSLDEVHAYRLYVDEAMVHLLTLELAAGGSEADRVGHQSRAAAPGVDRHRCEERPVGQSSAAGVSQLAVIMSSRERRRSSAAHLAEFSRRRVLHRLRGQWVCIRQRRSAAQRLSAALPAGFAPGHQRRVSGVHARRRLHQADALALRWLGRGHNNAWQAPLYWEQRDGEWWNYTMDGLEPLRLNEPVCHVSFYEADAFARWAGARLAQRIRVGDCGALLPRRRELCGVRCACIRSPLQRKNR